MTLPQNYHRLASASPFDVESHLSEDTAKAKSRATLIARQRVAGRFRTYVSKASNEAEREARIASIAQEILDAVHEACAEHDYAQSKEEIQEVLSRVTEDLRIPFKVASKGECKGCGKDKELNGDGECAACALDNDYEQHLERAAAVKEAELTGPQNTGDSYQGETQSVDKDGTPSTNSEPNVDSVRNPTEHQDVTDAPTDAKLDSDPATDGVTKTVDADEPIGSEEVGGKTETYSDPAGQANPVTSAVSAKWRVPSGE